MLRAFNSTGLKCVGYMSFLLKVLPDCVFKWTFLFTQVDEPISGMDFLRHYKLSITLRGIFTSSVLRRAPLINIVQVLSVSVQILLPN